MTMGDNTNHIGYYCLRAGRYCSYSNAAGFCTRTAICSDVINDMNQSANIKTTTFTELRGVKGMSIEELKRAISNLEKNIPIINDGGYASIGKNVLQSVLDNYKELLKYKEQENGE